MASEDEIGLLKLIAAQLYALNADAACRALCGKGFWEASLAQQQAAYQSANRLILDNYQWQEGLIQQATAEHPKPTASPVGFAPAAIAAPGSDPSDSPVPPEPRPSGRT